MKFYAVWRDPGLPVKEIEHPDAGYLHRNISRLKAGRRSEDGVELRAGMRDAGSKRTRRSDAAR